MDVGKAMSTVEAAGRIGISVRTLYNWTTAGKIKAYKDWRFRNMYAEEDVAKAALSRRSLSPRRSRAEAEAKA